MLTKAVSNVPSYQRETVPFLGLNRSDDTREGEFAAQKNMSDRRYPYLAPRLPRAKETFDTEPGALFSWDGAQIMVRDGALQYDGETLCNVTESPKQFAVINTKLVVWPDAVAVDLTNKKVEQMRATAVNRGTATFVHSPTTTSLTLEPECVYAETTLRYRDYEGRIPWIWTYSTVAWNEADGWTVEGGEWTAVGSSEGRYYVPEVAYSQTSGAYTAQMPETVFASKAPGEGGLPDNELGFYGLITGTERFDRTATSYVCDMAAEVYWAQQAGQPLDELFRVGDVVNVTGTLYGVRDVEKRIIKAIDPETNTLTFDPGVFLAGDAVGKLSKDISESLAVRWEKGDKTYRYGTNNNVVGEAGWYVVINTQTPAVRLYDTEWKLRKTYEAKSLSSTSGWTVTVLQPMDEFATAVTVSRPVPELDYICEHENRLWGVCNEEKTIYASALGDPCSFYDYSGEDTDSWAVAVGSEDNFSGICSYGNAVLCWKERTLHKVLGNYPSNYQTAVYRFAGVKYGAHKSMVNVNETLFYLGVDGVYAYTGNRPSLISKALGADVLADGVGGTDGRAYFLSVRNGEGWELLSYDTHTGLWTRSDETRVVDFARAGDAVKFLSGDSIYTIGGGDEAVEWEAVFVPMYETLEGGKQYNRLIFRAEVPKGGWMAADVRFDGGRWMQVGIVRGKTGAVRMPVPLRRCDQFQIRLRGVGDCAVLDMVREFRLRGDR